MRRRNNTKRKQPKRYKKYKSKKYKSKKYKSKKYKPKKYKSKKYKSKYTKKKTLGGNPMGEASNSANRAREARLAVLRAKEKAAAEAQAARVAEEQAAARIAEEQAAAEAQAARIAEEQAAAEAQAARIAEEQAVAEAQAARIAEEQAAQEEAPPHEFDYMYNPEVVPHQNIAKLNPTLCLEGHYLKMGLSPEAIQMLKTSNEQRIRPSNKELEKLVDRNNGMEIPYEEFDKKIKTKGIPVVFIAGHGSIRSGVPVDLKELEVTIINTTLSGSKSWWNRIQQRKTESGELVDIHHDILNYLTHIVGAEDRCTSDDDRNFNFFKPGRELNGGSHEVAQNFHYIPSCYSEVVGSRSGKNPIYLLIGKNEFSGHVSKNIFSWINPKVYGKGNASHITPGNVSWRRETSQSGLGPTPFHVPKAIEGLWPEPKTKAGLYIFNFDNTAEYTQPAALTVLCIKLQRIADIRSIGFPQSTLRSFLKSVGGGLRWRIGKDEASGLDYIHIYTWPEHVDDQHGNKYTIITRLDYKQMLTCFKKVFKCPYTVIDTVCRNSFSKTRIGDDTAALARETSTRQGNTEGRIPEEESLLYITIKAPQQLNLGDILAIYEKDVSRDPQARQYVYPFEIKAHHISQANRGVAADNISLNQTFDVQINPKDKVIMGLWMERGGAYAMEWLEPPVE